MKNKYLKENFEPIVLSSKNLTEILLKLGMCGKGDSRKTLKKYINEYNIDISHFESAKDRYSRTFNKNFSYLKFLLNNILIENSSYSNTNHLKERLYKEELKERKCELCGQDENWYGNHMSLILDHKNGINNDHRFENLRIVCPNCNATLPTHCRGANTIESQNLKLKTKLINKEKNTINRSLKTRTIERPLLNILQEEINKYGYRATGRKYGVCDNTIRKWIKFYTKFNI